MKYKIKSKFWINGREYNFDGERENLNIRIKDMILINKHEKDKGYSGKGIYEKIESEMKEELDLKIDSERIRKIVNGYI
jgi:hypothetical protein